MKNLFKNEKGFAANLVMAAVLVVVSLSAMVSLMRLVQDDRNNLTWLQDKCQQELLLRTEVTRINYIIARKMVNYPKRTVEILGKDRSVTYYLNHKPGKVMVNIGMGNSVSADQIETMIVTKHAKARLSSMTGKNSPVQTFVEKLARKSSLAEFQYFSDKEISDLTNDRSHPAADVKFDGNDVLYGKVHSNDDIYIQSTGGTWPQFKEKVTTAGQVMIWTSAGNSRPMTENDPAARFFEKGWQNFAPKIIYEPDATELRRYALDVAVNQDIYYLILGGNAYFAQIRYTRTPMTVWSNYPDAANPILLVNQTPAQASSNQPGGNINTPADLNRLHTQTGLHLNWTHWKDAEGRTDTRYYAQPRNFWFRYNKTIGDSLWQNYVDIADTVWSGAPGMNRPAIFSHAKATWVKGINSGAHTLGTYGNAYILDDISYHKSEKGIAPDAEGANYNREDYFGLVSEKKIIMKYKYWDVDAVPPRKTGHTYDPGFPGTNANNARLFMYGAYSAQGEADPSLGPEHAWRGEGTFTYEYQHPHGAYESYLGVITKSLVDTLFNGVTLSADPALWNTSGVAFPSQPTLPLVFIDYVDLHRLQYPPTQNTPNAGNPYWKKWPGSTGTDNGPVQGSQGTMGAPLYWGMYDYPFHNPMYPEYAGKLIYERGTVIIYGALAQRRRGFIHRSGQLRVDNPDTQNYWDWDNYILGGPHLSTGYKKQYYYDTRFTHTQPPYYPEVYTTSPAGRLAVYNQASWNFKVPPKNWTY